MQTFQKDLFYSVNNGVIIILEHLGSHWPFPFCGWIIVNVNILFQKLSHLHWAMGQVGEIYR